MAAKNDSYIYIKKSGPIKGVQQTKKVREQGMDDNFEQVYTIGVKQKSNIPQQHAVVYDDVAFAKGEMVRFVKNAKIIAEYLDNSRDHIGASPEVIESAIEKNVICVIDRDMPKGEKSVRVKVGDRVITVHRECLYSLSWEPDEMPRAEILNEKQIKAKLPHWVLRFDDVRPINIVSGSKFGNNVKFATKEGEGRYTVRKFVIGGNEVENLTAYGIVKTEAEAKAAAERP